MFGMHPNPWISGPGFKPRPASVLEGGKHKYLCKCSLSPNSLPWIGTPFPYPKIFISKKKKILKFSFLLYCRYISYHKLQWKN